MTDLTEKITMTIVGCARCRGDGHENLEFVPLTWPVEILDVKLTHWTSCPTNGEPILMTIQDVVGAVAVGDKAISAYAPPEQLADAGLQPKEALEAIGWKGPRDVVEDPYGDREPCPRCGQRIVVRPSGKMYAHKHTTDSGEVEWCRE